MRRVSKKKAKQRLSPEAEEYARMALEGLHCWACGRSLMQWPHDWGAPWVIERAHIVHNPRVEDRRAVILLDSACHRTSHGERIAGWELPQLTVAMMLWLKRERDPAFYDLAFLQKHSIKRLPEPEPPPQEYLDAYAIHRKLSVPK